MNQIVIRLDANIQWQIARDRKSDRWVGVCPALKVTAEAETWAEFCQTVNEIHNELFLDLLREGELHSFLTQHGWSGAGRIGPEECTMETKLPEEHHVWCNNVRSNPVKDCHWCDGPDGLWAVYPYSTDEEANTLMAKYFPQNIRRN